MEAAGSLCDSNLSCLVWSEVEGSLTILAIQLICSSDHLTLLRVIVKLARGQLLLDEALQEAKSQVKALILDMLLSQWNLENEILASIFQKSCLLMQELIVNGSLLNL